MGKKLRDKARPRQFNVKRIGDALLTRVEQRIASAGTLQIPAVPALVDEYAALCNALFATFGRRLGLEEVQDLRGQLAAALGAAFEGSQRSKIVIEFQAEAGRALRYAVKADVSSVEGAYERWLGKSDQPLFGAHADARVLAVVQELARREGRVLDLGAGTGRNALALARQGIAVDAVELTAKFADILRSEAEREALPVRVVARDVFAARAELGNDYAVFIASELVPDFRGVSDLRRLFELAADVLAVGGFLVVNLHIAVQGYTPEKAAREFAQQCYSAIFTTSEVQKALEGLAFELVSDDSVHDYEREHLPAEAWPPTPWYVNWVSGRDVYELARDECPIELCWLVLRKVEAHARATLSSSNLRRRRLEVDPATLRRALIRRWHRRIAASAEITLPAVPALADLYSGLCFTAFAALGREFSAEQVEEGKRLFAEVLSAAFAASSRSNIVVTCEAPRGSIGRYTVASDAVPLAPVYEEWLESSPEPLFGTAPDARLLTLMQAIDGRVRVLDAGAGLGRNALPLARSGHEVHAVELTPKFAELLRAAAERERLALRVIQADVRELSGMLAREYDVMLLSGVVSDFRSTAELRRLFELAAACVVDGGFLLVSVHVAAAGYAPDAAAREWAQQNSACFFTAEELAAARAGLPLELVSDEPSLEYERRHLPEGEFPVTEVYPEWASGTHLYALPADESPVTLRWLSFERSRSSSA